tara:strand:+ start:513 stop:725 length:213 start_codon:yes stop_codon:yes gene_type:complete
MTETNFYLFKNNKYIRDRPKNDPLAALNKRKIFLLILLTFILNLLFRPQEIKKAQRKLNKEVNNIIESDE